MDNIPVNEAGFFKLIFAILRRICKFLLKILLFIIPIGIIIAMLYGAVELTKHFDAKAQAKQAEEKKEYLKNLPPCPWENIDGDNYTMRMWVPTGWVICRPIYHSAAMCFVPDPQHEWKLNEVKK